MRKASKERRRGEASVLDAVMMLLKSFVGTGVLFLGKAFYNGGLLFSTITLCSVAIISLVSFLLLVKTNLNCPGSFGDMGGILFGPRMRFAILASIVLSQLGFVAAYTVFVAQNMQAFVLAVTHCKTLVPIWALILAQMAVFLPLSLIRRIAKLSTTALIADVFILFGIVYLYWYEIGKVANQGLADVVMFNSKDFPLFIGTAVFTFEGIGLVIPITESMKEPEKFPRALTGVMAGVMVLFASAGALSYMAFGSEIQTVVITNLPQNSRFVQAMQFLYSIAILLSTPLQLFPALAVLEKGIFTKSGKYNWKVKTEKNLFRFLVVAVCCLTAWAGANDLDKFVSLIGSVACVPLCFIYPPLLHLKANATRRATKALNYAMLVFGVVCVLFAGSQTIKAMLESSKPSGPPRCSPRV
nr:related to AVT3-Vacuolar transporter, involved in amino acid efflux from the vacuole [Melanopsichium pennsylvanicum 4]